MSRTFSYCRVSTAEQHTDNQIREIEAAGFAVEPHRVAAETISGSVAAMQRPAFAKLVDRLVSTAEQKSAMGRRKTRPSSYTPGGVA